MKKGISALAFLFCIWGAMAQIGTIEGTPEFSAPTITPVSPEAGKMTQYGNLPVNMSAGQMSFQVPIYEIPIRGGYSWPVSLNYKYAGLVLEAKPSISGLGWLLSGGGVVSREVRGVPDGNPYGIYGTENNDLITPIVNNTNITAGEAESVVSGRADTELDRYHVSVGGVSFSFKVDENNNPVYLSNHNYKVEFPNRTPTWLTDVRPGSVPVRYYGEEIRSFTVTDDKGIRYLFDEVEINEPQGFDLEPVFTEAGLHGYFSSWHLSRITFPNNQVIDFSYFDPPNVMLNYDYSASGYKNINPPYITQPGSCSNLQGDINNYNWNSRLTNIRRKLLSGIDFPTGSIDLNIVSPNNRYIYNQVLVRDSADQIIFDYDLTYDGPRDVLTEVDKDGFFYYEFEYHGGVPAFLLDNNDLPFKMDYWGFYNGRNNNYLLNIPESSISADKRPSFHNTRAGAMTRVKYPTGGYSQIQYEQNQVKKPISEVEDESHTPNRQIYLHLESDNGGSNTEKSVYFEYTFDHPVIALISHRVEAYDLQSRIHVGITTTCSPTPSPFNYYDAAVALRSPENPIPDFCVNLLDEIDPAQTSYPVIHDENSTGYVMINPGTYIFYIHAYNNHYSRSNGEILVQFYDPPEGNGDPYVNALVGGIRVHTISHVNNKGLVTKQNYDYNDDDGLSTGVELTKSQNEYVTEVLYDCYVEGVSNSPLFDTNHRYAFDRINYLSKSYTPVNLNSGVPVFYERVKQYPTMELIELPGGGGLQVWDFPNDQNPDGSLIFSVLGGSGNGNTTEFEERYTNGFSTTEFELPQFNQLQLNYPFTPFGDDLKIGRKEEEKIFAFERDSATYAPKSQTNYSYYPRVINPSGHNHPHNVNFALKRVYTINTRTVASLIDHSGGMSLPVPDGSNNADYYFMHVYRDTDMDFVLDTTIDKNIVDESNEVVTTSENTFDTNYQLKETTVTDSEGNTVKRKLYYPYDFTSSPYTGMTTANQISKVAMTETFENGVLNNTVKMDYSSVGGDYKPSRLLGAKRTNSLEGRMYYNYDSYGNVQEHYTGIEVIDVSGPFQITRPVNVTSFLWGYDHRFPVLKAENVSYSELASISIGDIQNMDGQTLRNELDIIRQAFPEALITTYTYDPFVGVTSETDSRGYTVFYEYDIQDRIQYIKDEGGNIVKEFNYNLVTD
ncbi:hypothetical protein POV27_00165 [Aureisphaera galaxeae]|uniref:hypothetical protein n=1 Tax=Aureisphaera galaxeae TaxID=1538023 RepID=UPI0023501541|nr:hypothetical protein [Aureisphaera galaxeae]MDC8002449.1 hypothetical protein [Aureisphaera galaxeae]